MLRDILISFYHTATGAVAPTRVPMGCRHWRRHDLYPDSSPPNGCLGGTVTKEIDAGSPGQATSVSADPIRRDQTL